MRKCQDLQTGELWAVKTILVSSFIGEDSRGADKVGKLPKTSRADAYQELAALTTVIGVRAAVQLREFYEEPVSSQPGTSFLYVVTELSGGGDLRHALTERGSLAEDDARAVLRSIFQCCVDMQSRGLLHRDIKLENILLSSQHDFHDGVTLGDFGLAIDLSVEHRATEVAGTPLYIAPEVILSGFDKHRGTEMDGVPSTSTDPGHSYSFEADMWGCGVVLYALLSGYLPFEPRASFDFPTVCKSIIRGEWSFSDPVWHMVSDSGRDLIARCLTVDPKRRITAHEALSHPWMLE